jgi:DNA-binding MarR family transcriptional regulator
MEHETAESIEVLSRTVTALLRRDGADLTTRQLAVFLTCYHDSEPQTVRGLAAKLEIPTPAVTRALNRLCDFDLVHRKPDPVDRRSVLIQQTSVNICRWCLSA